MKNIFWLIITTLITGHFIHNIAIAEECSNQSNKEDRYLLRSEDIGDELGLYVVKSLEGPEIQAIMIAWQDFMKRKGLTLKEMWSYKYYVYNFKGFFEVQIRTKELLPTIDDGGIYTYKIDAKDFSIISRLRSMGSESEGSPQN